MYDLIEARKHTVLFYPENSEILTRQRPHPTHFHQVNEWEPWVFRVVGLIIIGMLAYVGFQFYTDYRVSSDEGESTTATVLSRRSYYVRSNKGGGSWHYEITYGYVANDYQYQNKYKVSSEDYNRMQEGHTFIIRYLKSDPETVRPENYNAILNNPFILASVLFAVILGFIIVPAIITQQKNKYLKAHGKVVYGILEKATTIRKKNYHAVRVNIAFQSPDTTEYIHGTRNYKPEKTKDIPEIGSRVAIFYANKNNWEVL